jgi:hypothetical protein
MWTLSEQGSSKFQSYSGFRAVEKSHFGLGTDILPAYPKMNNKDLNERFELSASTDFWNFRDQFHPRHLPGSGTSCHWEY